MANAKINCTVESCMYNETRERLCMLNAIEVGAHTTNAKDKTETDCMSFECKQ